MKINLKEQTLQRGVPQELIGLQDLLWELPREKELLQSSLTFTGCQ